MYLVLRLTPAESGPADQAIATERLALDMGLNCGKNTVPQGGRE
jgi:hypothetical protein